MIDAIDARILTILQENARTSNAEIARQVDLAPSAVFERIRKLEERGVIEGYSARVNPTAVGLPLLAFIFVRDEERPGEASTAKLVSEIPEVLEVHHVAGEDCLLVKVRTTDTDALGKLLRDRLGRIPHDRHDADDDRARHGEGKLAASASVRRARAGRGGARPCLRRGPARQASTLARRGEALDARDRRGVRRGLRAVGLDLPRHSLLDGDASAFLHSGCAFLPRGRRPLCMGAVARREAADAARVGRRNDHRSPPLRLRQRRPRLGRALHPFGRGRSRRCNRTHVLRVVGGHAPPPKTARGRSRRPRPGHSGPPRSRRTGNVLRRRALPPRRLSRARGRDLRLGVGIAVLARLPASVLAAHGDGGHASDGRRASRPRRSRSPASSDGSTLPPCRRGRSSRRSISSSSARSWASPPISGCCATRPPRAYRRMPT